MEVAKTPDCRSRGRLKSPAQGHETDAKASLVKKLANAVAISLFMACGAKAAVADGDYFYMASGQFITNAGVHYQTADAACRTAYAMDSQAVQGWGANYRVLSYQGPVFDSAHSDPLGGSLLYSCATNVLVSYPDGSTSTLAIGDGVLGVRSSCPSGQTLNPVTGACEKPTDDQDRKEAGDPTEPLLGGVVTCAGNPVSIASGNKYQEEEDYSDADGELQFVRRYNGSVGGWLTTYDTFLDQDSYGRGFALVHADGRQSIFTLVNGILSPESTEQGNLKQVNGQWTYSSPTNEQYTFSADGSLVRWQLADGRAQTIARVVAPNYDTTITVTDSLGHKLQYVRDGMTWWPKSLTASGLAVSYLYDSQQRLSKVTRTWIYGRQEDITSPPLRLTEVSFVATPEELRSIAKFFTAQADALSEGKAFDHKHYLDFVGIDNEQEDIILVDPSSLTQS
ncbi:DUF6531 domain-containing protein [Dyella japonica]|uniref:DUF6531 domain-containing protein n=1 Tax=Dyella japonica TaxID=231455 RepID=A0ABV2JX86_9GAMM